MNFDKSTTRLHYLCIFSMPTKFKNDQRSTVMSLINWLIWKLACMLKTYKTCNPMVRFLKYEFNNKLLGGVTLLRLVISSVTWTQHIYIYIEMGSSYTYSNFK